MSKEIEKLKQNLLTVVYKTSDLNLLLNSMVVWYENDYVGNLKCIHFAAYDDVLPSGFIILSKVTNILNERMMIMENFLKDIPDTFQEIPKDLCNEIHKIYGDLRCFLAPNKVC